MNKREDEYSIKTMENRTRLHKEVVQAVRKAVGDDLPLLSVLVPVISVQAFWTRYWYPRTSSPKEQVWEYRKLVSVIL